VRVGLLLEAGEFRFGLQPLPGEIAVVPVGLGLGAWVIDS
jgi:hypothetical protein